MYAPSFHRDTELLADDAWRIANDKGIVSPVTLGSLFTSNLLAPLFSV